MLRCTHLNAKGERKRAFRFYLFADEIKAVKKIDEYKSNFEKASATYLLCAFLALVCQMFVKQYGCHLKRKKTHAVSRHFLTLPSAHPIWVLVYKKGETNDTDLDMT